MGRHRKQNPGASAIRMRRMREKQPQKPTGFCVVEWIDGKPFILELLVRRGQRHQGHGASLLRAAANLAGDCSLDLIARRRVHGFYKKFGFTIEGDLSNQLFEPDKGELYMSAAAKALDVVALEDSRIFSFTRRADLPPAWLQVYQAALLVQHREARLDLQPQDATYLVMSASAPGLTPHADSHALTYH